MPSSTSSADSIKDDKLDTKVDVSEVRDLEAQPVLTTIMSPYGKEIELNIQDPDSNDVDQALKVAEELEGIEVDMAKDAKLRRKLDWTILPLLGFLYMVQFSDKTCVSFGSVMGMRTDYNMVGQMYAWTTSCFYLGYLVACPFSSYLLQKLPAIRTVSIIILIWGMIQCLMPATKSYTTFILLRTMLGMLEAFVSPIFVIVLNQYYRKEEHFGRMAYFYGFNGLGTIFMGLVSAGLWKKEDVYGLASYKILFIIIGLMTILVGVVIFFVIPNTPAESKWLSQEEIALVVARIRGNQQGFGTRKFKKEQVIECISDIRTWLYLLIGMLVAIPNGGISSFSTIILKSFNYTTYQSLLMKAPGGAFELVFLVTLPITSKFIKSRMLVADIYLAVVLMAACLIAWASNTAAMVGIWIFAISPVGIACVSSCVTSNTAGHTKKLTANALSLMFYSAGNMIGPQTFQSSDAPNYPKAKTTVVVCYSLSIICIGLLAFLNRRENIRRDKIKAELGDKYHVVKNQEFADLTDFQNPEFRYSY